MMYFPGEKLYIKASSSFFQKNIIMNELNEANNSPLHHNIILLLSHFCLFRKEELDRRWDYQEKVPHNTITTRKPHAKLNGQRFDE
jgi:hypothetical protein